MPHNWHNINRKIPKNDGIIALNCRIWMMFIPVVSCVNAIPIWDFPIQKLPHTIMHSFILVWDEHRTPSD